MKPEIIREFFSVNRGFVLLSKLFHDVLYALMFDKIIISVYVSQGLEEFFIFCENAQFRLILLNSQRAIFTDQI